MLEYKTERVSPDSFDFTCQTYAAFGWFVQNQQEVYNEHQQITGIDRGPASVYNDGRISGGYDTVNTRTVVTHFISVTFARETTMPHYAELCRLEKKYWGKFSNYCDFLAELHEPRKPQPVALVLCTMLAVFVLIWLIAQTVLFFTGQVDSMTYLISWGAAVPMMLPLVISAIVYPKKVKKYKTVLLPEYQAKLKEKTRFCEEIVDISSEAEELQNKTTND